MARAQANLASKQLRLRTVLDELSDFTYQPTKIELLELSQDDATINRSNTVLDTSSKVNDSIGSTVPPLRIIVRELLKEIEKILRKNLPSKGIKFPIPSP